MHCDIMHCDIIMHCENALYIGITGNLTIYFTLVDCDVIMHCDIIMHCDNALHIGVTGNLTIYSSFLDCDVMTFSTLHHSFLVLKLMIKMFRRVYLQIQESAK